MNLSKLQIFILVVSVCFGILAGTLAGSARESLIYTIGFVSILILSFWCVHKLKLFSKN